MNTKEFHKHRIKSLTVGIHSISHGPAKNEI